jgi:hypothetical protein
MAEPTQAKGFSKPVPGKATTDGQRTTHNLRLNILRTYHTQTAF